MNYPEIEIFLESEIYAALKKSGIKLQRWAKCIEAWNQIPLLGGFRDGDYMLNMDELILYYRGKYYHTDRHDSKINLPQEIK